jgi:hypothetical protein
MRNLVSNSIRISIIRGQRALTGSRCRPSDDKISPHSEPARRWPQRRDDHRNGERGGTPRAQIPKYRPVVCSSVIAKSPAGGAFPQPSDVGVCQRRWRTRPQGKNATGGSAVVRRRMNYPVGEVTPLSIVYRNVDELTPLPNNARKHSKKQIKQIAKSIEAFGLMFRS